MKVALSIGHSPKEGGAVMSDGSKYSEYRFWQEKLPMLKEALQALGHEAVITNRSYAGGTSPSYAAKACNATGADLAIEFHFNVAESCRATGTETLYWHKSTNGKRAAELVNDAMCEALKLPCRGIKPVSSASDRAASYFTRTTMPAILVEPAFAGSNVTDCDRLQERVALLCKAIAHAVHTYAATI